MGFGIKTGDYGVDEMARERRFCAHCIHFAQLELDHDEVRTHLN